MPGKNLCLLSLDGGGFRGLSSLYILKHFMETINPNSPPKPCEYFDMIGGTSTGGLMAIMLGRLRMDIDECIDTYINLFDRVFKKRHRVTIMNKVQARFDTKDLEKAIKEIVLKQSGSENTLLCDGDGQKVQCKIFVCAYLGMRGRPIQFKNYRSPDYSSDCLSSDFLQTTKIWEATRATLATPSLFDSIKINDEEIFHGGGIYSDQTNPVRLLWKEAQNSLGESLEENLKCLVSIGAGSVPSLESFGENMQQIGKTVKYMEIQAEATAEEFYRTHLTLDRNQYFRFNMTYRSDEIGPEETAEISRIRAKTRRYMESRIGKGQILPGEKNIEEKKAGREKSPGRKHTPKITFASSHSVHTASSFQGAPALEEDQNILTIIRQQMHQAVPKSTHTAESKYKFTYDCNWMLPIVLNEQFDSNQRLSDVVTLTGTAQNAQAASCSEYVSQFWPKAGSFLLEILGEWLQSRGRKQSWPRSSSIGDVSIEDIYQERALRAVDIFRTIVTIVAGFEAQIEVAATLSWLAAAVRSSSSSRLVTSEIEFSSIREKSEIRSHHARFSIDMRDLEQRPVGTNMCWYPLFRSIVLAGQFPIARRNEGDGLELSPRLMVTLAGSALSVPFRRGSVLRGLSTVLVPIKEYNGGKAIQWHLVVANSPDHPIDQDDLNAELAGIRILEVEDACALLFRSKKAYLGWCQYADILLGTQDSYKTVNSSHPSETSSQARFSGASVGTALSISAGLGAWRGTVQGNATVNYAVAKNVQPNYMKPKQELKEFLAFSRTTPCLLYDTLSECAWLVPQSCVLLQMMHLRQREWKKAGLTNEVEFGPFIRTSGDAGGGAGGDAGGNALRILSQISEGESRTAHGSSDEWRTALINLHIVLQWARKGVTDALDKNGGSQTGWIYGYELLDVASISSDYRFNERKVRCLSSGLEKITGQIGYALFASGLGNVIVPTPRKTNLSSGCRKVPIGCGYLAAYIPCTAAHFNRQGEFEACHALVDQARRRNLFEGCKPTECAGFKVHTHCYQKFGKGDEKRVVDSSVKPEMFSEWGQEHWSNASGAIVFGHDPQDNNKKTNRNLTTRRDKQGRADALSGAGSIEMTTLNIGENNSGLRDRKERPACTRGFSGFEANSVRRPSPSGSPALRLVGRHGTPQPTQNKSTVGEVPVRHPLM